MSRGSIIPVERIGNAIHSIRDVQVMLDEDLAVLYGVPVKALNQAVKRNRDRFPADFMFQLTKAEFDDLRSQGVTARSWGGRRVPPFAFTEHGVAMLSSVLRSPRAVRVNIEIMRTFVMLRRRAIAIHTLERQLKQLERKYDAQFKTVFDAIRKLIEPAQHKPTLGFARKEIG